MKPRLLLVIALSAIILAVPVNKIISKQKAEIRARDKKIEQIQKENKTLHKQLQTKLDIKARIARAVAAEAAKPAPQPQAAPAAPVVPPPAPAPVVATNLATWLYKLRMCESTGNYQINTGNGFYGAYQFMINTWNVAATRSGRLDLVGVRPDLAAPSDQDAMIVFNTNITAGISTQNPGCYRSTGISNKPPAN